MKAAANLAKALKIRRVTGVVQGVLRRANHVAPEAAVEVPQHAGAPVLGRRLRDRELSVLQILPPFHFMNLAKSKPGNNVSYVLGNNDLRRSAAAPASKLGNGAQ